MNKAYVFETRPENVPEDFIIMNAPRPLVGDILWKGDFVSGRYFAAAPPENGYVMKTNEKLDCVVVEYIDIETAKKMIVKYNPRYGEKIVTLGEEYIKQHFHSMSRKFN